MLGDSFECLASDFAVGRALLFKKFIVSIIKVTVIFSMCCTIPEKKIMPLALGIRELGIGHRLLGLNIPTMVNSSRMVLPSIHWKVTILNESVTLSTLSMFPATRRRVGKWNLFLSVSSGVS